MCYAGACLWDYPTLLAFEVNNGFYWGILKTIISYMCFCFFLCGDFYYSCCQTVHEGRIYQLKLFCDKDYPEKPPSVRFHSRINMTCVNHETGVVEPKKFGLSCKLAEGVYNGGYIDTVEERNGSPT